MSRGITIASLVQKIVFSMYGVILPVEGPEATVYHSKTNKFRETVMAANLVLEEMQKDQDWNFLRRNVVLGPAINPPQGIQEFGPLDDAIYHPCMGYGDAVRLRDPRTNRILERVPWTSPRMINEQPVKMFNEWGAYSIPDASQRATLVGDSVITFSRPWHPNEHGLLVETDVIERLPELHICTDSCPDSCRKTYEDQVLRMIPDISYVIYATAAKLLVYDPSSAGTMQTMSDNARKVLSAMREQDSAHNEPDTYKSAELGYVQVL